MMSVVYEVVIALLVQTVPVFQTVLHMKMSVMFVMKIHLMTVYRIVLVPGAEVL